MFKIEGREAIDRIAFGLRCREVASKISPFTSSTTMLPLKRSVFGMT
jgi:hypothetical protein